MVKKTCGRRAYSCINLSWVQLSHAFQCPEIFLKNIGRSTLIRQRPMKSLSSVFPSVTKFSQDWIIIFFLILYMMIAGHDIQCLTQPDICKKYILVARIWAKWAKIRNETSFFCHFLKCVFLVFFEFTYSDSLQQCVTSSGGKILEKNFWAQIWAKGIKIWPEIRSFVIFSSLVHQFSLNLHTMIACKYI